MIIIEFLIGLVELEILNSNEPHYTIIKMLGELRHDMVNHLQVIHAYAKIGRTNSIVEYIDNISLELQSHSRISNMGHYMIAANLYKMMFKYPELQVDYYTTRSRLSLETHTGLKETELCEIFIDIIIAMAAHASNYNKAHIVISVEPPDKGKKSKIQFSLHGNKLSEQPQAIACLRKKLSKYNAKLCQVHQDSEVLDWELIFN